MQLTHIHYNLRKHFLVTELLLQQLYGTVWLMMLLKLQILLAFLRIVWIRFALIKILNLTGIGITGIGSRS